MEQNFIALKLMLDGLGVPFEIKSVDDRKTLQKAVYLGQAAGVDLGYRYNWYRMGPYSPGLTRDYFGMSEALEGGESSDGYELQQSARDRVARVQPLLAVPEDVPLGLADWLELLASVHFLRVRRRLDWSGVRSVLQKEKQHVAPYADRALTMLQTEDLIPAA